MAQYNVDTDISLHAGQQSEIAKVVEQHLLGSGFAGQLQEFGGGNLAKKLYYDMLEAPLGRREFQLPIGIAANLAAASDDIPFIEWGTAGGSALSSSTDFWFFANTTAGDFTAGNGRNLFTVNGLPDNADQTFWENNSRYLRVKGARTATSTYQNAGGAGWQVSFVTNAPIVKITGLGTTTVAWYLFVDDNPVFSDSGITATATPQDMYITYSTSKWRKFTLQLSNDQGFGKVAIGNAYSMGPTPKPRTTIVVPADSYLGSVGNTTLSRYTLAQTLRWVLGCNVVVQSIGASGLVAGNNFTNVYRQEDVVRAVGTGNTIIMPIVGNNDTGSAAATVQANMTALLQYIDTNAKGIPVFPLMLNSVTNVDANALATEQAIGAAVTAMRLDHVRQIKTVERDTPYFTGKALPGNGITSSYGSAFAYIGGNGSDFTHLNDKLGTFPIARRIAKDLARILPYIPQ